MEDNGVMMTSEPAAGYVTATYADVMDYIHSGHVSRKRPNLGPGLIWLR